MYKEVKKFKIKSSFTFTPDQNLEEVCNAPDNGNGVFLVFAVEGETKELIMIGSTGTVQNDVHLKVKAVAFTTKL